MTYRSQTIVISDVYWMYIQFYTQGFSNFDYSIKKIEEEKNIFLKFSDLKKSDVLQ